MAKINSSTFNDFVRNANITWRKGFEFVPLVVKALYDISENELLITEHSSLDGFTYADRLNEGDNYSQQVPVQNYSKTMTKYRVGLEAVITWQMRKYDKYREITGKLQSLGENVAKRMELDLTHRFTFGTATTYTDRNGVSVSISTGDGLALFSTAHTVTGSTTTYRNRVANNPVFSRAGLEAAEALFAQQMINSLGEKVVVTPDTIVIAWDPATENTVREFLNSTATPSLSNSGVTNVYQGKYELLKLPLLATTATGARDSTKEKYWMLACKAHTDAVCQISEMPHMVAPSMGSNAEEFDNDDWKFKASGSWGIEIVDPKWIVFSSGDLTA